MGTVSFESVLAEWAEQDRQDDLFRQRSPILWWLRHRPIGWLYALRRNVAHWYDVLFYGLPLRLRHGFWVSETWSLDRTIAEFTLPRLRYLQAHTHGFPTEAGNELVWHATMGEIIWFLEQHASDGGLWNLSPQDMPRYERAGQLFGKYFGALWD